MASLAERAVEVIPRIVRVMARASRDGADEPLTLSQVRLLRRLAAGSRLVTHLAEDLAVAAPTVSATVDALVRRGLVERQETTEDRRTVPLALTEAGRAALAASLERQRRALEAVFARMDDRGRAALAEALEALDAALGSSCCGHDDG